MQWWRAPGPPARVGTGTPPHRMHGRAHCNPDCGPHRVHHRSCSGRHGAPQHRQAGRRHAWECGYRHQCCDGRHHQALPWRLACIGWPSRNHYPIGWFRDLPECHGDTHPPRGHRSLSNASQSPSPLPRQCRSSLLINAPPPRALPFWHWVRRLSGEVETRGWRVGARAGHSMDVQDDPHVHESILRCLCLLDDTSIREVSMVCGGRNLCP